MILLRKRYIWGSMLLCAFFMCMGGILWVGSSQRLAAFAAQEELPVTVVVDPGHGGEDGGASSAKGVTESQLNLEISLRLYDLLRFAGQRTILTRSTGEAIHTEGDTIRARKVSDIHNRVDMVNRAENAVLISVHQNSLPSSTVTRGAYVFWNQAAEAENLAKVLQDALNNTVNAGNEKQAKKIPATIYLMNHVAAPSVLVECGFLSNTEEAENLQEPSYQRMLAVAIASGYLRCLTGEELS